MAPQRGKHMLVKRVIPVAAVLCFIQVIWRHNRTEKMLLYGKSNVFFTEPDATPDASVFDGDISLNLKLRKFFQNPMFIETPQGSAYLCSVKKSSSEFFSAMGSYYCENTQDVRCSLVYYERMLDKICTVSVIRNPVDRFLSAYADKCINDRNFAETHAEYAGMRKCVGMHVRDVLGYLSKVLNEGRPNRSFQFAVQDHFYPQSWSCRLLEKSSQTFVLVKFTANDSSDSLGKKVMRAFGLCGLNTDTMSSNVQHLVYHSVDANGTTISGITGENLKETVLDMLKSDPKAAYLFLKVYAIDYYFFDFPVPLWLQDMALKAVSPEKAERLTQFIRNLNSSYSIPFAV